MANLIKPVDHILKQVRAGYPEGIESIARMLPVLFERIQELENLASSFARVAVQSGANDGKPLVNVYLSDCRRAFDLLDETQSVPATGPHVEYLPAE